MAVPPHINRSSSSLLTPLPLAPFCSLLCALQAKFLFLFVALLLASASAALVCGPGTYAISSSSAACSDCTAGTYAAGDDNTECTTCDAGYGSQGKATECTECEAGTYAAAAGACSDCPAGTYAAAKATECTKCNPGYGSQKKATECNQGCAAYQSESDKKCPDNYFAIDANTCAAPACSDDVDFTPGDSGQSECCTTKETGEQTTTGSWNANVGSVITAGTTESSGATAMPSVGLVAMLVAAVYRLL